MQPSAQEVAAAPLSSHAAILAKLLGGKGRRALDIGCGDGKFTWLMAQHFPELTGVDVNEKKVAAAREEAASKGLAVKFQAASGEALPFPDAHFDCVVFSNSLHHIPDMVKSVAEGARVTRPGGLVYVMEPVPWSSYFEATRLVNDETDIRTQAWRIVQGSGKVGLTPVGEPMYKARRTFADLEEWRDDQIARDLKRSQLFEANKVEVRRRFESNADRSNGGYTFEQISRVNLLRKVA